MRWREHIEAGAGILYDLGSHLIDQALCLFGAPEWLQANLCTQRAGATVDDGFDILMGRGKLRISLGASSVAADHGFRYQLDGADASFRKSGLDPQELQLKSGMSLSDPKFGVEPHSQWGSVTVGATGVRTRLEPQRGSWPVFYQQMRRAIEADAGVPVTAADGSTADRLGIDLITQINGTEIDGMATRLAARVNDFEVPDGYPRKRIRSMLPRTVIPETSEARPSMKSSLVKHCSTISAQRATLRSAREANSLISSCPSAIWLMMNTELLPWTSKCVDDMAFIRSMHTEAINHDPACTFVMTGSEVPGKPSLGSWLSYGLGSDSNDLPSFVVLTPSWKSGAAAGSAVKSRSQAHLPAAANPGCHLRRRFVF